MDGRTTDFAWPIERLSDAVEALARISGLQAKPVSGASHRWSQDLPGGATVEGGIESLSRTLDFEVESADVAYASVKKMLATAAPALVRVSAAGEDKILVLVDSSGHSIKLLALDGRPCKVAAAIAAEWITRHLEEPIGGEVDQLLSDSCVPTSRWAAARQALFATRLGPLPATRCWMLRPNPAASLWHHMCHARLPRRLLVFVLAYAGAAVASLCAWALIGSAALEGRFDPGTLLAWSFLLVTVLPLSLFAMWSQAFFIVGASGILKMQLLAGALKLDADETRSQGVGRHFARVIDCSSLEGLALAGGFYALTAFFDLSLALGLLIATGRWTPFAALLSFVGASSAIGFSYFKERERWTATRLLLTHNLVEKMVGHRTRLVQASHSREHDDEDEALSRYLELSKRTDRAALVLSMLPRAWLLVGLGVMAPQFVSGEVTSSTLAVGLGITLLVCSALVKGIASLTTLVDAAVSWRQVAPLLRALRRPEVLGHIDLAGESVSRIRESRSGPLVAAQDLAFRFRGRPDSVLKACGFRIAAGDRIRVIGRSGAGKSTLVSLLTGLRVADSGLLLLHGLDRATLGSKSWRRQIAAAPQFHENHLFSDTLAFNLLMGRRWPPTADDLRWAETACRRLGLGDLLDRMPNGLFQPVGEAGWQLSHGERSLVFIARALLQGADLVVLDESFAELDPDSLQRCLPVAAELAKSLLVVAHA